MRTDTGLGFALYAAAGLAGGVVLNLLIVLGNFRPTPGPFLVLGMVVGALVWAIQHTPRAARRPEWSLPRAPAYSASFTADLQTRRLAAMVVGAQPGKAFSTGELAATLRERVTERLGRRGDLPDDGLGAAAAHLSPELHRYLTADEPPPLHRRTLHTFLKEIEQL